MENNFHKIELHKSDQVAVVNLESTFWCHSIGRRSINNAEVCHIILICLSFKANIKFVSLLNWKVKWKLEDLNLCRLFKRTFFDFQIPVVLNFGKRKLTKQNNDDE